MHAHLLSPHQFFAAHTDVVHVRLAAVKGSSPREEGAQMYVSRSAEWGTIGGGQLELMAVERARDLLQSADDSAQMDVPLGPEINQCCGGHVQVALHKMTALDKDAALTSAQEDIDALPHIYICGAGHVGRALAAQLQHQPVRCILLDTRKEALDLCSAEVETRLCVMPEAEIKNAPAGSAFVVLTHDHTLDFLLTSEALRRADAIYVGMIGSQTKRAVFSAWMKKECDGVAIEPLICPIGTTESRDKRPSLIAAFVAAEILSKI